MPQPKCEWAWALPLVAARVPMSVSVVRVATVILDLVMTISIRLISGGLRPRCDHRARRAEREQSHSAARRQARFFYERQFVAVFRCGRAKDPDRRGGGKLPERSASVRCASGRHKT